MQQVAGGDPANQREANSACIQPIGERHLDRGHHQHSSSRGVQQSQQRTGTREGEGEGAAVGASSASRGTSMRWLGQLSGGGGGGRTSGTFDGRQIDPKRMEELRRFAIAEASHGGPREKFEPGTSRGAVDKETGRFEHAGAGGRDAVHRRLVRRATEQERTGSRPFAHGSLEGSGRAGSGAGMDGRRGSRSRGVDGDGDDYVGQSLEVPPE